MRTVYKVSYRLSERDHLNPHIMDTFSFPTPVMINKMLKNGVLHTLAGLATRHKDENCSLGGEFNFIMSNGSRSEQKYAGLKLYDHLIPADSNKNIKRVDIHQRTERRHGDYNSWITGFFFFDQDHSFLWRIGETGNKITTVVLSDNEVITGVVATL